MNEGNLSYFYPGCHKLFSFLIACAVKHEQKIESASVMKPL